MTLVRPDQPASIKLQGLRLLPIVVPPDGDVGPVAALLDEPELRERGPRGARRDRHAPSRAALRGHLARADPDFACASLELAGPAPRPRKPRGDRCR